MHGDLCAVKIYYLDKLACKLVHFIHSFFMGRQVRLKLFKFLLQNLNMLQVLAQLF